MTGFLQAIRVICPKTRVQLSIVHLVCNYFDHVLGQNKSE
ncbi:hypothetical protein KQ311_12290 [Synechocystis sp. CS-94]|nr:hypothetical protein [Synechocystis sp. CS-94]